MTSTTVDPFRNATQRPPQWIRLRVGQILAAQVAIAGVLAAIGQDPPLLAAAGTAALFVVVVAFARVRGRWLFAWLGTAVRYATHRRTLPPHTTSAGLLRFLAPDLAATDDGCLVDADGLITIFELEDPVAAAPTPLPDLSGLLDRPEDPPATLQLLVTVTRPRIDHIGIPGLAAASYRQLGGEQVPAQRRILVVLRVGRPPGWSDAALRPSMSALARRVAKRLGAHRRLDHDTALTTIAEVAHHDGSFDVEERWSFLLIGGLAQATYRMTLPTPPGRDGADLARTMQTLLALPTTATTVNLSDDSVTLAGRASASRDGGTATSRRGGASASRHGSTLTSRDGGAARISGGARDAASGHGRGRPKTAPVTRIAIRVAVETTDHLVRVDHALQRLAASEGASLRRLDGSHGSELLRTLPLGGYSPWLGLERSSRPIAPARPERPPEAAPPDLAQAPPTQPSRPRPRPRPRRRPIRHEVAEQPPRAPGLPEVGMVLGHDRHGNQLRVRIFRPTGTRIVLVGALWTAQVIGLRTLALGARIDIRTRRWAAWNSFAEETAGTAMTVTPDAAPLRHWLTPPEHPAGTPFHPGLIILDVSTIGTPVNRHAQATDGTASPAPGTSRPTAPPRRHVLEQEDPGQVPTETQREPPPRPPDARWQTMLAVRDEITEADSALLAAADLVLLQAVRPGDARIAAKALGLPDPAGWLGRLEGETVAVAAGGAMRWAVLAATPVERALTTHQHLTTSMRRSP